jgi:hypothetical protein
MELPLDFTQPISYSKNKQDHLCNDEEYRVIAWEATGASFFKWIGTQGLKKITFEIIKDAETRPHPDYTGIELTETRIRLVEAS